MYSKTTGATQQKPKAGKNTWSFSGKILKKNVKFSQNGNQFANLQIEIPAKNPKYSTKLWLKAFKEKAEEVDNLVKDGENYAFWGYVATSSYEKDGQKVYSTDFIINGFTEADPEDTSEASVTETGEAKKEDVPF